MLSKNDFDHPTAKIDSTSGANAQRRFKSPFVPIRLLRILILQPVRGYFFDSIGHEPTSRRLLDPLVGAGQATWVLPSNLRNSSAQLGKRLCNPVNQETDAFRLILGGRINDLQRGAARREFLQKLNEGTGLQVCGDIPK